MSKKNIASNADLRKGLEHGYINRRGGESAESAGASVEKFDLFRLEKYTGCISCFGCKREKNRFDWLWSMYNPETKKLRHETIFPQECKKAYDMGAVLVVKTMP